MSDDQPLLPRPPRCVHPSQLEANPELRGVVSSGANVLPQAVIEEAFADQYGKTLNFRNFRGALAKLNSWCAPCAAAWQLCCTAPC